jgi:hypothetical protein
MIIPGYSPVQCGGHAGLHILPLAEGDGQAGRSPLWEEIIQLISLEFLLQTDIFLTKISQSLASISLTFLHKFVVLKHLIFLVYI